jgi:hypothetical protein
MLHFASFFLAFKSNLLVKRILSLSNAAFAMAIVDLIPRVQISEMFHVFLLFLIYHNL